MIVPSPSAVTTPDDLLQMPDGDGYELVDGQLVERNMSFWSSYIAGRMFRRLDMHVDTHQLGWVAPEGTSYRCFANAPHTVRRPDVSFLRRDRLSADQAQAEGHMTVAPDLAVEVVSPNDTYYEVVQKVEEWLREGGVQLLWVVNPHTRQVRVYRADGSDTLLNENDELTGETIVPGFRCRVGELFALPPGVAPPASPQSL